MMKLTIMSSDTTEDYGPDMVRFVCSVCDSTYYDTNLYFRGQPSTKCLSCFKFGKVKAVAKKTTEIVEINPENG
jgi:transposase-like protein